MAAGCRMPWSALNGLFLSLLHKDVYIKTPSLCRSSISGTISSFQSGQKLLVKNAEYCKFTTE